MLRYLLATFALSSALLVAAACGSDANESVFGGTGSDSGDDGSSGNSSGDFGPGDDSGNGSDDTDAGQVGVLTAVIRDFRLYDGGAAVGATNPDFENITQAMVDVAGAKSGLSEGSAKYGPYVYAPDGVTSVTARFPYDIVLPDLDSDGIPIYTTTAFDGGAPRTFTTHGKSFFDQWYRDVDGVNIRREIPITLTNDGNGVYTYDSAKVGTPLADAAAAGDDPNHKEFFPIDDGSDAATAFGNQGDPHNYSFTVELRTKFTYKGNETFTFSGDDDVFVFINKKLVINIGGVHEALTKTISVADWAAEAGLVVGKEYTLDFFQAERHRTESNLRIETTLNLKANTTVK